MSESSCDSPVMRANGAPNVLRLPTWVLSRIAVREAAFTGQLVVNFFQGGVTNIEWREIQKQMK